MRKITKKAISAFIAKQSFKEANTEVVISEDGKDATLLLYGHPIAECFGAKRLYVNICGWNTATTHERLNGLPGVQINIKKGVLYLNGNKWKGQKTLVSSDYYMKLNY